MNGVPQIFRLSKTDSSEFSQFVSVNRLTFSVCKLCLTKTVCITCLCFDWLLAVWFDDRDCTESFQTDMQLQSVWQCQASYSNERKIVVSWSRISRWWSLSVNAACVKPINRSRQKEMTKPRAGGVGSQNKITVHPGTVITWFTLYVADRRRLPPELVQLRHLAVGASRAGSYIQASSATSRALSSINLPRYLHFQLFDPEQRIDRKIWK